MRFLQRLLTVGLLVWCSPAGAQPAGLLPNGEQTFVDLNGQPFAGGSVYFYIPSTTTPKTTWVDTGEGTPNSNPVVLDSAGRAVIYGAGSYREVLKDQFGNTIWDQLTQAPVFGTVTSVTCYGVVITGSGTCTTTGQTPGIATNTAASAGNVGQIVTGNATVNDSGSNVEFNVTSISLTAGDWDVTGSAGLNAGASPGMFSVAFSISTTSTTVGPTGSTIEYSNAAAAYTANLGNSWALPTVQVIVASTTTVYCVGAVSYASGGPYSTNCLLRARRVR